MDKVLTVDIDKNDDNTFNLMIEILNTGGEFISTHHCEQINIQHLSYNQLFYFQKAIKDALENNNG